MTIWGYLAPQKVTEKGGSNFYSAFLKMGLFKMNYNVFSHIKNVTKIYNFFSIFYVLRTRLRSKNVVNFITRVVEDSLTRMPL